MRHAGIRSAFPPSRPRILAFLRARPLSVRHSFAPFLLSKAVARKTQASDLPLTEAKRRHVFNSQRCSKKSKMQIFAFIFAVQPRIKQKISIHKAHDLLYDTLCKKEHKHMRSALKDTTQRNKSLAGFVKCTSCVKFAFSE